MPSCSLSLSYLDDFLPILSDKHLRHLRQRIPFCLGQVYLVPLANTVIRNTGKSDPVKKVIVRYPPLLPFPLPDTRSVRQPPVPPISSPAVGFPAMKSTRRAISSSDMRSMVSAA